MLLELDASSILFHILFHPRIIVSEIDTKIESENRELNDKNERQYFITFNIYN
jgi:hypothetical protein